jgi:hypothetical protein
VIVAEEQLRSGWPPGERTGSICDLAARFGAMTYFDEVHSAGM